MEFSLGFTIPPALREVPVLAVEIQVYYKEGEGRDGFRTMKCCS
jgi:hypothetical protein